MSNILFLALNFVLLHKSHDTSICCETTLYEHVERQDVCAICQVIYYIYTL
jgi:hypothetical protein